MPIWNMYESPPTFRPWCCSLLHSEYSTLPGTLPVHTIIRALRSKRWQDFIHVSSWYVKTVNPICSLSLLINLLLSYGFGIPLDSQHFARDWPKIPSASHVVKVKTTLPSKCGTYEAAWSAHQPRDNAHSSSCWTSPHFQVNAGSFEQHDLSSFRMLLVMTTGHDHKLKEAERVVKAILFSKSKAVEICQ